MQKLVSFDKNLKQAIKKSVKTLAKAVKSTLGPAGTNVLVLSQIKLPIITNDGVTVAKSFVTALAEKQPDKLETRIAQLLNTVSKNTESAAGDGTTTSITLAEAIILEGLKNIEAGFSSVNIAKGIHKATKEILSQLDKISTSVIKDKDLLLQVASISANNDNELGKIISEAFLKVGIDGQIDIKDSTTDKTYVDIVNGMKYSSGFESNMFINTNKSNVVLENCSILIYEGKLTTIDPIVETLRDTKNNNTSLFIIADDYSEEAINDLVYNKVNAKVKICAVRSPGYGIAKEANLEDIADVTKTKIVSRRFGTTLDNLDQTMLGFTTAVKINSDSFVIINEKTDKKAIKNRVKTLKEELKKATVGTNKAELADRIAKLSNGVAILYVHGNSSIERAEKRYRVEDAINATRASLEEGIVPGGGITLLKLGKALKMPKMDNREQEIGFNILIKALEAPIKTICTNSDVKGDVVVNEVLKGNFNFGYDARLKEYKDLIAVGIIDPKKVTRVALQNASSVAQMILTLNCAIY